MEGENEVKSFGGFVWGFFTVKRGKKDFLVFIGSGGENGEHTFASIESFYLNVIDLKSMNHVYKNLVKPEIAYTLWYSSGCW